ncbi:hypothetical protein [uncultured Alistipes sp.]
MFDHLRSCQLCIGKRYSHYQIILLSGIKGL